MTARKTHSLLLQLSDIQQTPASFSKLFGTLQEIKLLLMQGQEVPAFAS